MQTLMNARNEVHVNVMAAAAKTRGVVMIANAMEILFILKNEMFVLVRY